MQYLDSNTNEFYCVQCRKIVNVKHTNTKVQYDRRNRPRLIGLDRENHVVYRYIKFRDADVLEQFYGRV